MLCSCLGHKSYKLQCFFCPQLRNAMNPNAFVVPSSEMSWITMTFVTLAQNCYELQCFVCPMNYNTVFVPSLEMIQIPMLFLSPAQKCYELQRFFCPRLRNPFFSWSESWFLHGISTVLLWTLTFCLSYHKSLPSRRLNLSITRSQPDRIMDSIIHSLLHWLKHWVIYLIDYVTKSKAAMASPHSATYNK